MNWNKVKKGVLFFLLALFLGVGKAQGAKIQAVATFSILEDLVRQVGGERVEVVALVPFDVDPHVWEATPKEARLLANAQILFANGAGFDNWLLDLQRSAAQPQATLVVLSQGMQLLGEGDPHLWLSVPYAMDYVRKIAQALSALSPGDAAYFSTRADNYLQELADLDQRLLLELAEIPKEGRVLVTYHNAFTYFADRYDFAVREFLVRNPDEEPSAREMGRLVGILRQLSKPVLFREPQLGAGHRYLEALAQEVQGSIAVLYTDSLSPEVPTYVEMMEHNKRILLEALLP